MWRGMHASFRSNVCDNVMVIKQYPDTVTIRTPMHTPMLRGPQARGPHALGPLGANLRVRLSRVDHDMIVRVAEDLGMKKAEFIRWCAVEVAKQLDEG